MNIIIRVDSSVEMGTGHVIRCLTLAKQLKNQGAEVSFICSNLIGNIIELIIKEGYQVYQIDSVCLEESDTKRWELDSSQSISIIKKLPQNLDWIIVDHYGLDKFWEKSIRPYTKRIMVIDDLANRGHDCELLLDQNLYTNMEKRYDSLVNEGCKLLLGPSYALLRNEFYEQRIQLRERSGKIERILVFFGGSDPANQTERVLNCIKNSFPNNLAFEVIVGKSNPNKMLLENICSQHENIKFFCQVENMAAKIADADLAISAGGTNTWERCFLGLPAITITIADNQIEILETLANMKVIWHLGHYTEVDDHTILETLNYVLDNPELVKKYAENNKVLMGGNYDHDNILRNIIELQNG